MQGLPRTKETKTHIYKCQMEEPGAYKALSTADESAGGNVSSESGPCAHTRRCVEEDIGEKIGAWRRVDH